jgi:hypothetical protein
MHFVTRLRMRFVPFARRLRGISLRDQDGMTTAELLGNAALGIAALVAIWAVLQTLGLDVVDWMRGQLRV